MVHIDHALFVVIGHAEDEIDLAGCQGQLFRVAEDHLGHMQVHPAFIFIIVVSLVVLEKVFPELLDINVHDSAARQVEPHIVQVVRKIRVLDLIVAELHHVVAQQQVDLLDVQVARPVQHLLDIVETDFARVLLRLRIRIVELESALQDQIDGLNFSFKDEFKRLFIDLFDI